MDKNYNISLTKNQTYINTLYEESIEDLLNNNLVMSMTSYMHHEGVTCLEHCKNVSFLSFKICYKLNLDYRSAARGALLHDFYLYDWHIPGSHVGLHGFRHSKIALKNAKKHFALNQIEIDVIEKHMWPLNIKFPKYKESIIVSLVDKYFSITEIISFRVKKVKKLLYKFKS